MVVRRHDFNCEWWGGEVGIVDIEKFAVADDSEVLSELVRFEWVEARSGGGVPIDLGRLCSLGFFQVDTHVRFRIRLSSIEMTTSLLELEVRSADEESFDVEANQILDFASDRFSRLPGCTPEKARERYALWSRGLIEAQPEHALRILKDGEVQGYYLGRMTETGFDLTLAMLTVESRITGMHLYQRALLEFGERGIKIGGASFSVHNGPVLNIYSELGARFTSTEMFWFRMR